MFGHGGNPGKFESGSINFYDSCENQGAVKFYGSLVFTIHDSAYSACMACLYVMYSYVPVYAVNEKKESDLFLKVECCSI